MRISSSVLMKIAKHDIDSTKGIAWGQILGIKQGHYIEISDSYPLLAVSLNVRPSKPIQQTAEKEILT